METSMLNERPKKDTIEPEIKNQAGAPRFLFIDLDLLDGNPYQPRAERDPLKAAELRQSIASQGQLQPILVRRAGSRWQIIFGHGRVEALRKLCSEATTQAERSRYSKVRAEERSDVSDEQMLLLGLMENIQREDISPVDCAAALARLKSLRPDLETTEDIARETKIDHTKAKRLLRLHAAPQVIKDAVSKGKTVLVRVDDEDTDPKLEDVPLGESERKLQETRRLNFSSALALARLYAHWCENPADQPPSEGSPDERMAALIDRALTQDWGVRRVRAEVGKLARGDVGSPGIHGSSGRENLKDAVPFKVNRKKVVIFTSRLAQMNDDQKAQLRSVLEPIWNQLGGQTQLAPTGDKGPLHWMGQVPQLRRDLKQMAQGCRKLWRIFLFYIVGKTPTDQLPRSVQLPSCREARSEKRPVALLPTGAAQPSATSPKSNGSERRLSS